MAPRTRAAAARRTTSRWVVALLLLAAACGDSRGDRTTERPGDGTRFPDFTLDNLRDRDEQVTFEDLAAGRPAVVNFFASWCAPCKRELPALVDAYDKYGGDIAFVGVDTEDSANEGLEMLERYGVEYPAVYDPDATIRNALGRTGLPVTAFVAPDGTVTRIVARELSADDLEEEIDALVNPENP